MLYLLLFTKFPFLLFFGSIISGRIPIISKQDISIGLARNGYATLYTGGGAEYNGKREKLEKEIAWAKKKKKGIWINGVSIQTPAEYKKSIKNGINQ